MIDKPSTADKTVMEGVITPSAKSVEAPTMAIMYTNRFFFLKRANNAKIPPSPLLSALKVINIYLIVVCRVKVQIMHDNAPIIKDGSFTPSLIIAFITYKGDVPISP